MKQNMKKTIVLIFSALVTFSSVAMAADAAEMSAQTVKPSKKAKAEIREVTFNVHLHCNSCVKKIQENIAFEKGVKDLKVSLEEQTVYVKYDASKTNEEVLKNAIIKLGVPVIDKGHSGHDHKH